MILKRAVCAKQVIHHLEISLTIWMGTFGRLAHQNRTIAIASDFRVDGAKSPEIPHKEGVYLFYGFSLGEAFLLRIGAFLLTIKLLRLQSLKALIGRTFPL